MENATRIQELLDHFGKIMLIFLPVLFGAVEFIKQKLHFSGRVVELLAVGIFSLFGVLVVVSYYYPEKGVSAAAVIIFLLMCALAPSGLYKFINQRSSKGE